MNLRKRMGGLCTKRMKKYLTPKKSTVTHLTPPFF